MQFSPWLLKMVTFFCGCNVYRILLWLTLSANLTTLKNVNEKKTFNIYISLHHIKFNHDLPYPQRPWYHSQFYHASLAPRTGPRGAWRQRSGSRSRECGTARADTRGAPGGGKVGMWVENYYDKRVLSSELHVGLDGHTC